MSMFSSVGRVFDGFALELSMYCHQFSKSVLQMRQRQLEQAVRVDEQLKAMLYEMAAPAVQPQPVSTPPASSQPAKCMLEESDPLFPVVYEYFGRELRPNIMAKYPAAPKDKVDKVILQKWNTIEVAKKDAFIKKVLRKIELERQAAMNPQPKHQDSAAQDGAKQQEPAEEEVLVKQEAPDEEPQENRLSQFVSRVTQNVRGMQEQARQKEEGEEEEPRGQPMQEEPRSDYQAERSDYQEERTEEAETQKMEEEEDD